MNHNLVFLALIHYLVTHLNSWSMIHRVTIEMYLDIPHLGKKKACHHSSFKPHFFVFKALRWVFHTGHSDNLTVLTITWSLSEEEKISSKHLPRMLLDLVCRRIGSCSAQMCPELPTSVIFLSLKQINFL